MEQPGTRTSDQNPAQRLATPAQFLPGVGPQRVELLERLGLRTARDLLFHFPRDYQDLTALDRVANLEEDQLVRLRGSVAEVEARNSSAGRTVLGVLVRDAAGGHVRALWFNQPYMTQRFTVGQQVLLMGKARLRGGVWQMVHPAVTWIDPDEAEAPSELVPVYPATEGLSQAALRRIMRGVLNEFASVPEEVFPVALLNEHELLPLAAALADIHFPPDRERLERARRRFIFQELLVLQLALASERARHVDARQAPALEPSARIDARILRLLPFELTPGQRRAIDEVRGDMAQPRPMHRLLQGDVGSGKTIVAVYAMLLAIAHRQQVALMAPTEILARQHGDTLGRILSSSHVRWTCLTGGTTGSERSKAIVALKAGELDAVIGTQAVLQDDVEFARLGLVVIDEQHKFGVVQRASLKQAAQAPHYLVMTATPIPRTVALTTFGDLEVSTIFDSPPGRQPVHSYLATEEQRERWWEFFARKLREGRQGYVVAPRIDDTDDATASIAAVYERLSNGPLADFRLGLIHGRLSSAEKEAVIGSFQSGQLQVLVSTTIIEVGIDIPNATLLAVEGAQQFGLSQLHQLRGRVARGSHPGYCCVFADDPSPAALERLEAFVRTADGFELAELDFRLRGPGDLLGTKQHGLPPFRIADLARDVEVVAETRTVARELVALDPERNRPELAKLWAMVERRYGRVLGLGTVG